MMAKILKVTKKNYLKSAIDLGIAMQLTNISRDVVEDSKNNRSYINEDFAEISSTIKLADTFYENSFYSIKYIPIRFRFSILVARRVYRKIGSKILMQKNLENYSNAGKIYVTNFGKIVETFLSFYDLLRLFFISSKKNLKQNEYKMLDKEINLDERI
jgi:phytoene synthase